MEKLFIPFSVILLSVAISCGAAQKDSQSESAPVTKAASSVGYQLPDSIKVSKVEKPEDEWKQILTDKEYQILREEGTERAFSSDLLDIKKEGIYYCAACGLPLYNSETKFESGTGWPSFYMPVDPMVVKKVEDRSMGMVRTEIECAQCGSHIGHVFNDGPEPSGLRYCMNGLALSFKEKSL